MSSALREFWKDMWGLDIPPRIKMLVCTACTNALPSKDALASKVYNYDAHHGFCGAACVTVVHALLECPHACSIWQKTPLVDLIER